MLDEMIDAFPGGMTPDAEGPIIEPSPFDRLRALSASTGDLSGAIDVDGSWPSLSSIGQRVVEEYERDKTDRKEWAEVAEKALKVASQAKEIKSSGRNFPWDGCADVHYPLLTTACLQFNARAYPAIVKGDEAISVKVVGQDKGRPETVMGPNGPVPLAVLPDGQKVPAPMLPPEAMQAAQPAWAIPPGAKTRRAQRVTEYLNTTLFYRMEDWEDDTDTLTIQLPAVGCVFRKVWFDAFSRQQKAALVPALRIFVPMGARSVKTTPRLTEELPDVYPYEIQEKQRAGFYRDIILDDEEEERAGGRLLLEQHCMMDLDEDGLDEPYIVTVDHKTQRVLRIEANFGPQDVVSDGQGRVLSIKRGSYFVKYDLFPHPDGGFYGLGLGHLLDQLGDVINTAINQLIDAGTAQTAGGGFIASGVRLQSRGNNVRFTPGEYKTVDTSGADLRMGIYERTSPQVSPVTFQVLDLILGAARDISGVKDVITGEASNTGQVGTTLALIEQGLQVFNAIYKRIYRSLKKEFTLIYQNVALAGTGPEGEDVRRDYMEVLDDPAANFEEDFNQQNMDIRPVSDPASVTLMQKMAKAQFLLGTAEQAVAAQQNPIVRAILKRVYEAAGVENVDEILPDMPPAGPDPLMVAKAQETESKAQRNAAAAQKDTVVAEGQKIENAAKAFEYGAAVGSMAA